MAADDPALRLFRALLWVAVLWGVGLVVVTH